MSSWALFPEAKYSFYSTLYQRRRRIWVNNTGDQYTKMYEDVSSNDIFVQTERRQYNQTVQCTIRHGSVKVGYEIVLVLLEDIN